MAQIDTPFNNYRIRLELQEKNKEIYKYVRILSGVWSPCNIRLWIWVDVDPDYKSISCIC